MRVIKFSILLFLSAYALADTTAAIKAGSIKNGAATYNINSTSGTYTLQGNDLAHVSSGLIMASVSFGPKASSCSATTLPATGCSSSPCDLCQAHGVSSVVWSSTGVYVVNFSTSYGTAPYCFVSVTNYAGATSNSPICVPTAMSTSAVTLQCTNTGGALNNTSANVACIGVR